MDREDVDLAALPLDVQAYVDRLHGLFGPERLALTTPGYTHYMVHLLQEGKVSYILSGEVCRLKMPNAGAVMDRMFNRMGCWVNLVMEVLRTFWNWETFWKCSFFGFKGSPVHDILANSFWVFAFPSLYLNYSK